MKFGKTMKAVALGLAFTAAAGLVTVRKAVADLFKFSYTSHSNFYEVQDPSLGNKIISAYLIVDINPGFEGQVTSFADWGISTKEGSIGYEIKKDSPGAYLLNDTILHIEQDMSEGFRVTGYFFGASNNDICIITRNITLYYDMVFDYRANASNIVWYPQGTWSYEPVSAVPLPPSVLLLGTGLGGLALARRIRKTKTAPKNNLG